MPLLRTLYTASQHEVQVVSVTSKLAQLAHSAAGLQGHSSHYYWDRLVRDSAIRLR